MPDKPTRKPKRGRPDRLTASRRALRNVDVTTCNPKLVLQTICMDASQPGSTRVSACRALAELDAIEAQALAAMNGATARDKPKDGDREDGDASDADDITKEALAMLREPGMAN